MNSRENIERIIFQLSKKDRSILARNLIRSIENEHEEENVTTDLWIKEAERRYQKLKQGKIIGIPANQVFMEARNRIH
ncbi:MAG: addiction module antitoxin RelB [Promethearchaeota archaeon]|nr:MAG: addiction module antitoxin RelB [Candidatus Lokiarchaeota archaeon]